jgi:hypothetical protein
LLFLPLLLWKRRFVEAAAAIAFVIVFNLIAPALFWGPHAAWDAVVHHVQYDQRVMSFEDPAENGVEPPSHGSHSLMLAIARYLQTYPTGHPLFIDEGYDDRGCIQRAVPTTECRQHPLFVQFLDLPAAAAKRIVVITLFAIAIGLAWRFRRNWLLAETVRDGEEAYSSFAPEWAVACLFAAILSPMAWAQHLVLILPCGYLVIRDLLMRDDQLWLRWGVLGLMFVLIWILPRDPLPLRLSLVVLSYHADVFAMLMLAALTLTIRGAIVPASVQTA